MKEKLKKLSIADLHALVILLRELMYNRVSTKAELKYEQLKMACLEELDSRISNLL